MSRDQNITYRREVYDQVTTAGHKLRFMAKSRSLERVCCFLFKNFATAVFKGEVQFRGIYMEMKT